MVRVLPHGNRVLAEQRDVSQVGDIVMPIGAQGAFTMHVIDVGEGKRLDNGTIVPIKFKAGDEIVFYPGGAMPLPSEFFGGKQYILVDADAIVCKVERDQPGDGMGGTRIVKPNGRIVNLQ